MKKLYFLSTLMLFVMVAFLPQGLNAQTEETHVTSFGTYNFAGKHFCILSNMENVSSEDVEFKEYARYISYVFLMKGGIEVSPQSQEAEVCILMSYDIKDASYVRTVSEPVWGQTTVSSVTASKNFLGGTDYNYHYNYGVVNYTQSQHLVNSYNRYIDLFAYELSSNENDQQKMIWKGYAKSNGRENNLFKAFPGMALTFYNAIGRTAEDTWLNNSNLVYYTVVDLFKSGQFCKKTSTYLPYVENGWEKTNPEAVVSFFNVNPHNRFYPWVIQKNPSNTIVIFSINWDKMVDSWYRANVWHKFPKNIYIQYNGEKYECLYAENLNRQRFKLGKIYKAKGNEVYNGSTIAYLIFPPLPADAKVIDIICQKQQNNSSKDDIAWKGIHLRNW